MNTIQTVIDDIKNTWGEQVEMLEDKFFHMIKVPSSYCRNYSTN